MFERQALPIGFSRTGGSGSPERRFLGCRIACGAARASRAADLHGRRGSAEIEGSRSNQDAVLAPGDSPLEAGGSRLWLPRSCLTYRPEGLKASRVSMRGRRRRRWGPSSEIVTAQPADSRCSFNDAAITGCVSHVSTWFPRSARSVTVSEDSLGWSTYCMSARWRTCLRGMVVPGTSLRSI